MKNLIIAHVGRTRTFDPTRKSSTGSSANKRAGKLNKKVVKTEHDYFTSRIVVKYNFQTMERYLTDGSF